MKQVKGIVLIDEIDMHMHPKWQWNIIDALRTTFKNVQFIIATHSPIVISSSKEENLILLEKDYQTTSAGKLSNLVKVKNGKLLSLMTRKQYAIRFKMTFLEMKLRKY